MHVFISRLRRMENVTHEALLQLQESNFIDREEDLVCS